MAVKHLLRPLLTVNLSHTRLLTRTTLQVSFKAFNYSNCVRDTPGNFIVGVFGRCRYLRS